MSQMAEINYIENWRKDEPSFDKFLNDQKNIFTRKLVGLSKVSGNEREKQTKALNAELWVAYRISSTGQLPTWEPLGRNKLGPDFHTSYKKGGVFFEVKHLGPREEEKNIDIVENGLRKVIHATESPFAISFDFQDELKPSHIKSEFFLNFPQALHEVLNQIFPTLKKTLKPDTETIIDLNSLCGLPITMRIGHPPGKYISRTAWYGISRPIYYRNNEHLGMLDSYLSACRQAVKGKPNILWIRITSDVHEQYDFSQIRFSRVLRDKKRLEKHKLPLDEKALIDRINNISAVFLDGPWCSDKPVIGKTFILNSLANFEVKKDVVDLIGRRPPQPWY